MALTQVTVCITCGVNAGGCLSWSPYLFSSSSDPQSWKWCEEEKGDQWERDGTRKRKNRGVWGRASVCVWGFFVLRVEDPGGAGCCVREAQLGNEKCNPPLHTTTLYSHIQRTHTHDPHLFILPSGKTVWRCWWWRRRRRGGGRRRERHGEGDR